MNGYSELASRVDRLAFKVGLRAEPLGRFPHEFSGGQRQRIGIARALALVWIGMGVLLTAVCHLCAQRPSFGAEFRRWPFTH
jgi:hypothetical protein